MCRGEERVDKAKRAANAAADSYGRVSRGQAVECAAERQQEKGRGRERWPATVLSVLPRAVLLCAVRCALTVCSSVSRCVLNSVASSDCACLPLLACLLALARSQHGAVQWHPTTPHAAAPTEHHA